MICVYILVHKAAFMHSFTYMLILVYIFLYMVIDIIPKEKATDVLYSKGTELILS